jgi:hypothetical protein
MQLEELAQLNKFNELIGNRTRDLLGLAMLLLYLVALFII